jgi:D-glycero-D-manno-heptose 1,7-bisphosphate phosphatase
MSGTHRGVILDRDGTLIDVVRDEEIGVVTVAFHPRHLRLLPGVVAGLQLLRDAGYVLCLATNQPGAAKGQLSVGAIERTNAALQILLAEHDLALASVEVCLHHPDGGPGGDPTLVGPCECRKPRPGLLLRAMATAHLDPARTWMVGDSPGDVEAARAAGIRAGLVFPLNRCELCPQRDRPSAQPDAVAARFDDLARAILEQDGRDATGG